MGRIINLDGALRPVRTAVDCGSCANFYKKEPIPAKCRECRHFPLIKGNTRDNYVFTPFPRRGC